VSAGADRLTALLEPADVRAVRAGRVRVIGGARLGTPDSLRVVGYPVATSGPSSGQTVLVAVSQAEATGSLRALTVATAIGAPLLVAGFALVCWLLIGRSLRPVSRLRAGAEEIAAAGRSDGRRLPVPLAQDEVRRLAETLNGMLDRLEAASTAQRAFVADAAHELRSPLTAIRTQLEVARRHPDAEGWEQTAEGVLADTDRLARLVDDLLLLARSGDASPQRERRARRIDLSDVATDVASGPWRVPVDVETGAAYVVADPDAVTRILTNLVDNAARHASSRVQIAVQTVDGVAELRVADDGPGIPAADRERVFERFARLDPARSRPDGGDGGSGLGLAIVRSLVLGTGGSVRLDDPPNGAPGTWAVVSWPPGPRGD
jgi:signal transduction histidine kinase